MKISRRLSGFLLMAACLAGTGLAAWCWAPDIPVDQLKARWARSPSKFVALHGMQVHVRDEGPSDDPLPLVLIHGTSSSLHTWEGWSSALRSSRRVIRFDLPGFGLTGPNANHDYSMEAYVRFVAALLDQLGISRYVIGGNSLGGEVAWRTALAYPQRVEKLILVAATGYRFESTSVPLAFRIARTPGLRKAMTYFLPPGMVEQSLQNVYGDPSRVTPALIELYSDMARRAGNRDALGSRMAQALADHEEGIRELALPTLILWGRQDRLVPPVNAMRFKEDIAGSKLVIFESLGHVPQEEDPSATITALQAFL